MVKFEKVKAEALGHFGLISTRMAKKLGANSCDLVRWVRIGRLENPARGVYRLSDYPPSRCDPYAIAVEAVGSDARLVGESVLGLLELTNTNPSWIYVGVPSRVRRKLESDIVLRQVDSNAEVCHYEGVRCESVSSAIRRCMSELLPERIEEAMANGKRLGLLDRDFAL